MPENSLTPNAILYWHPKFRVYTLKNNDTLLVKSGSSTLLKDSDYPILKHIDGTTSLENLLQKFNLDKRLSKIFVLLDSLITKGYLINILSANIPNYHTPRISIFDINNGEYHKANHVTGDGIINLSSASNKLVRQWENVIRDVSIVKDKEKEYGQRQNMTVVLVDDFLDVRVLDALRQTTHYLVIRPSNENYWLGPISTHQNPLDWASFRTRLLHNLPTLRFLSQHLGLEHVVCPIQHIEMEDDCNIPKLIESLDNHISSSLRSNNHALCIVHRSNFSISIHPVALTNNRYRKHPSNNKITLTQRKVIFDADGGVRSITPAATVEKLLPFVSPITGRITHLEELGTKASEHIKIFTSGFYKQPRHNENLSNRSFVQLCMGKGATPIQSKASALSEAIERLAAFYEDHDTSILASPETLTKRYYLHQDIAPFSHTQYTEFETNQTNYEIKQSAQVYRGQKILWANTWSLTHNEAVHVPLSLCYQNTPSDDYRYGNWTSNGCAAGNNKEEAILQAMFELIERDATAIWWYNKVKRPVYNTRNLSENFIKKIELALLQDQDFWLLDITSDFGIPVIAAVARCKKTGGFSLGFGCHLSAPLAAQRALTELCQLIPIRSQKNNIFNFDQIQNEDFLHADDSLSSTTPPRSSFTDIKEMITHLTKKLAEKGIETLALDYSRPDLPLRTVKIIAPGLCHIWPQFANERLYTVPAKLAWIEKPKTETQLNPIKLYI